MRAREQKEEEIDREEIFTVVRVAQDLEDVSTILTQSNAKAYAYDSTVSLGVSLMHEKVGTRKNSYVN